MADILFVASRLPFPPNKEIKYAHSIFYVILRRGIGYGWARSLTTPLIGRMSKRFSLTVAHFSFVL